MSADPEKIALLPSAEVDKEEEVDARPPSEENNKETKYFVFPKNENGVVTFVMQPIRYFTKGSFMKKMNSSKYQSGWRYLLIGGCWSKRRTVRFHWRFGVFWMLAGIIAVVVHWLTLKSGGREWEDPDPNRGRYGE